MILKTFKNIDEIPPEDLLSIATYDKDKTFDYFGNPFTFDIGIVTDDDRIIGAGIIRVINEFKMIMNPHLPKLTRIKTLKLLIEKAIELKQCSEVLVSLTSPYGEKDLKNYIKLLRSEYGFYEDLGKVLRRD